MSLQITKWRDSARIIWAITAKDLMEALKNKNTLTILLSSLFIVVFYRWLPTLEAGQEPLRLRVYDTGNSVLVAYLENSRAFDARTGYESEAAMKSRLADADIAELGLVIPADFDQRLEAGSEVELLGYRIYWVDEQKATELKRLVEDEIAYLLGRPVPIHLEGNVVYHSPESRGLGLQAAMSIIFAVTMIGLTMIPHLMLVEKQSRTLDALLVSPASETHVVTAKALTGLFYCLIGAGTGLALNYSLVVHWWLALLAVFCYSLFVISLGLLLGMKIEDRGQLTLWGWVLILPLFLPVFLYLLAELLPETLIQIVRWVPSAVTFDVLRYAFANPISLFTPLLYTLWILVWGIAVAAVAVWLVRRRDRGVETSSGLAQKLLARSFADSSSTPQEEIVSRAVQSQPTGSLQLQPVQDKEISSSGNEGWRIIWAIATKDMREALKNKLFISILVGTALVILNGLALPFFLDLREKPAAMIYDEGRSTILRGLAGRDDFRLAFVDSQQELEEFISQGPGTWLGLVVPADFDQQVGDSQVIELEGYAAHWADQAKIDQWAALFEEQLGLAVWGTVRINRGGHLVYPPTEPGGQISIHLLTMMIAITAIGIALVPLLLIEEKEAHTLEALLVSPAKLTHIFISKWFVGILFCLVASGVAILLNRHWFIRWEIALLAALLTAILAVAIGMLVGMLADNPTSAAIWAGPLILIFVVPTMIGFFNLTLHPFIQTILRWSPGTLMLKLFQLSVSGEAPASLLWSSALALVGMAAAIYLLIGWHAQRLNP